MANKSNSTQLPDGITTQTLGENFRIANTEYSAAFKRARKLDLADRNKMWKAVNVNFPKYQILPETNHVSYIKNNLLASIYVVGKSASLLPTSKVDMELVQHLNVALEHIWGQLDVPYFQMLAGERAALLNLGVTQVGWDNSIVTGKDANFEKGQCVLKNVDPLKYMRDPFSQSLDTAGYVITWDEYHESVLLANPNYRESFKAYKESNQSGYGVTESTITAGTDRVSMDATSKSQYYKVFIQWVRQGKAIHEVHTIDNKYVLFVKDNIKPSKFPFSELYCNIPNGNLLGNSEPNKIFANSLAYNLMNSILLTAEYRNQCPPKFINGQSGLNVASFTKHGNEADHTFVVQGDAGKAVHYHQFPAPSAVTITGMSVLGNDIKGITGIDDRYTGRDTGSILTTGGVNSMLDQVTMIDAPKITNYEHYCKQLTQLIVYNYIAFSTIPRNYYIKDKRNPKVWKQVSVDFPEVSEDILFDYELIISSELPKNKTVIANMANKLMEMQMQYSARNIQVDLITPEEWLMLQQDLPFKEMMLDRMGIQRNQNWTEATAQIVTQYAGLVQNGMPPEEALQATASTMEAQSSSGGVEDVIANVQQGGMM